MLLKFLSVIFRIAISLLIFVIHICLANLLPPPWNHINILILIAVWFLIFRDQSNFIRYIFALSVVSELFHSTPFGINTAALLITVAILDWLLLNVLTNRFFLIVFVAGALSIALYRVCAIALLYLWNLFSGGSVYLSQNFLFALLWECAINGAVLTIAYLIPTIYTKKMNPSYLTERDYVNRSSI